jgi:hypothetical protein
VDSVTHVNIVKKTKVNGDWKLHSIPRNTKGNYDWNALPEGLYLIEWRAGGKRRLEALKKPNTHRKYEAVLKRFLDHFRDRDSIDSISADDLTGFDSAQERFTGERLCSLVKAPRAPKTCSQGNAIWSRATSAPPFGTLPGFRLDLRTHDDLAAKELGA